MSYWFLTQLTNNFLAVDGIISLISPAAGIGLVAIVLGGYQFIPAIILGSLLAYSPYHLPYWSAPNLPLVSIFLLSIISALQSFVGAFLLNRLCDLSKGINSVKDFYLLWLVGGYVSAFVGAIISSMTLYISNDLTLSYGVIKTATLWWQGNALGIGLSASTLLILLTAENIKDQLSSQYRILEFIVLFGITFISGQVIFLNWYPELLGSIGRGYWVYLYISIAAIRFGKHGVVLVLLMTTIQAVYGAVQQTGFFGWDIESTNLTNFWVYIQIVALVGMLQAIIIENKKNQASFDDLTHLPNRRLFMTSLQSEIAKTRRNETMLGLIFIDIDHFKEVNDTLGHHIGDELLTLTAARFKNCVRESDIIARIGGDEFTVIIPDIHNISHIDAVANKIINILHPPFELAGRQVFISASAGIAVYPNDSTSMEDLLKFADQSMYSAKSSGKNRFHYFTTEMQEKVEMRNQLMQDLHSAVKNNQLEMYYQPIIDAKSGKCMKAEALIRWNHPEKGFINPEVFIAIAEETGNMTILGDWIVNNVLTQLADWRCNYNSDIVLAINISPLQFMNPLGNKKIRDIIQRLAIPSEQVILEITEGVLLDGHSDIFNEFKNFCDIDIKLSIDDFGTGYSSLSYIKKFPIHFLKIDKSFINDIEDNKDSKALVKAIIAMANALEMKVVGEGVETVGQLKILEDLGCDFIQGYFYSKPLTAEEFVKFLE
jgi:diguanylate cyclase (GGDEF)-like protein